MSQGPEPEASLTKSALTGTAWNYASAAVLIVLQLASTAITARLVAPSQFGAYAAAQAAAGIFGYFTLSAIGQGLLRRRSLGPRMVGTATVMSLVSGAIITLVMWIVAEPWSSAWHVSATSLVRVLALALFFTSCSTVPLALLRRQLRFRAAAAAETGSQVIGVTAGVLLAASLHSAMALVIGQAVAASALFAATSCLAWRELRVDFRPRDARELFSFAGQVSGLNVGFYALYTAPSWIIARQFGAHALGLYSRANLIITLPVSYFTTGLTKVMYPLYGRIGTEVTRLRTLLTEALVMATGFSWPLLALVAGSAPVVVRVLLGPDWTGSSGLLRLCSLIACGNLPWVLLTNAAEAFGWMRLVWIRQFGYLVLLGAGAGLAHFAGWGINELLLAVAAAQWVAYGLTASVFTRRGHLDGRSIATSHLIHGLVASAAFCCSALCAELLRNNALVVQVIGELAVTAGLLGALFLGRFRFPATRVLTERLSQAIPGEGSRLEFTWSRG